MSDYSELANNLEKYAEHNASIVGQSIMHRAASVIRTMAADIKQLNALNNMQEEIIKKQARQLADLWVEQQ